MHLLLTLFYSEKKRGEGRASPSCVAAAAAASSPSPAGPLESFIMEKKNHSVRGIVMLIFFRGYSSASFRATMPLLLSGGVYAKRVGRGSSGAASSSCDNVL